MVKDIIFGVMNIQLAFLGAMAIMVGFAEGDYLLATALTPLPIIQAYWGFNYLEGDGR